MLLSTIAEIGMNLLLIGFLCCLPTIVVVWLIAGAVASLQQRKVGERLGGALGLHPLNDASNPLRAWHGGSHHGRTYAIQPFLVGSSSYMDGRRRTTWSTSLRIVLPLDVEQPPGVNVSPNTKNRTAANFSEAFLGEGLDRLSPNTRRALYGFSRLGEPTGLRISGSLRFSRGRRSISLLDRDGGAKKLFPAEDFPDSTALLIYDIPDGGTSAGEIRKRLDQMVELARTIEADAPAPGLDPDQIPPEAAWRQHAGLAMTIAIAAGIPTAICLCSVLYGSLRGS